MRKLTKKIFFLGILLVSNVYAASQIKVICDEDNQKIYLNKKFKSSCDKDEPVAMLVKAGRYTVKAKKYNSDGSFYYYKKSFRIGDGVQKNIEIDSSLHYTEKYYYSKVKKSHNNIKSYWNFLNKYPNGTYSKYVKSFLDEYYFKRCNNVENYKFYLSKIPWGLHRKAVNQKLRKIYINQYSHELINAAFKGKLKVVKLLIAKGADIYYPKKIKQHFEISYFKYDKIRTTKRG